MKDTDTIIYIFGIGALCFALRFYWFRVLACFLILLIWGACVIIMPIYFVWRDQSIGSLIGPIILGPFWFIFAKGAMNWYKDQEQYRGGFWKPLSHQ